MSAGGGKVRNNHRRHDDHDEEHEEHVNHEAWVIPYADMITLLMALFLMLFAVGRTDAVKFEQLGEGFRDQFGKPAPATAIVDFGSTGSSPLDGGNGVLENSGAEVPRPEQVPTTTSASGAAGASAAEIASARFEEDYNAAVAAAESLHEVEIRLQEQADALGIGDDIMFELDQRGLVLTIVSDQVLFRPGGADLQPEGLRILDLVAVALQTIPNSVAIEGHTDSRPISTNRFPSNWELSTTRATSVLRFLVDVHGLDGRRLSAAGYADTRPIDDNSTEPGAARNRRVEILILSSVSLQPVLDAGTTDDVAVDLGGDADVVASGDVDTVAAPNI